MMSWIEVVKASDTEVIYFGMDEKGGSLRVKNNTTPRHATKDHGSKK